MYSLQLWGAARKTPSARRLHGGRFELALRPDRACAVKPWLRCAFAVASAHGAGQRLQSPRRFRRAELLRPLVPQARRLDVGREPIDLEFAQDRSEERRVGKEGGVG